MPTINTSKVSVSFSQDELWKLFPAILAEAVEKHTGIKLDATKLVFNLLDCDGEINWSTDAASAKSGTTPTKRDLSSYCLVPHKAVPAIEIYEGEPVIETPKKAATGVRRRR